MTDSFRFDHVIITVHDLDVAIENFRLLGFSVFYGGRHASGTTHNALIILADGTYLELLAPTGEPVADPEASDFLPIARRPEGLTGYAMLSEDLAGDVDAMRHRGIDVTDPVVGSRHRPDGQLLRWQTANIDGDVNPFFIEDLTPRLLRVDYRPENLQQANGVTGVHSLTVVVESLQAGVERFKAMLDTPPLTDHHAAHFLAGSAYLVITEPTDDLLRSHLEQYGPMPYQLTLKTDAANRAGMLDIEMAHGARIQLVAG